MTTYRFSVIGFIIKSGLSASHQQNVCAMVGFSVTQSAIFVQRLVTWDNEAFQSPTTAQTQTLAARHPDENRTNEI